MIRFAQVAAGAALLVCPSIALATTEAFRAQGNEPSWSLHKTDEAITLKTMDGKTLTVAPVPAPTKEGEAEIFKATIDSKNFVLTLINKLCIDSMSGMPFPISATVVLGADTFEGCGGHPVALLRGAWRIAEIDGTPIIDKTEPTLDFAADGRLSGSGSCNRFFGSYTLSGEGLTISQLGSSMMMCDEKIMNQERAILEILKKARSFSIGAGGALLLKSGDGRAITGHR